MAEAPRDTVGVDTEEDLARAEAAVGATRERLIELRGLGNDAARKAYAENPSNSFTIETYVRNLIQNAEIDPEHAVELCIEGLGILFSALSIDRNLRHHSHT